MTVKTSLQSELGTMVQKTVREVGKERERESEWKKRVRDREDETMRQREMK